MFWKKKGKAHYPVKMLAIAMTAMTALSFGIFPVGAQAATTSNSDFTIENGLLTSYQGKGGTVTIPDGVTSIDSNVFMSCMNLKSVTIPSSVTKIGVEAFLDCENLANINIPLRVTNIEYGEFGGCSSLTNIIIPSNVTSIGYGAFSGCSNLTSLTIPSSVTSIGNDVFEDGPNQIDPVTLTVDKGSYAESYAKRNGIPYVIAETTEKYVAVANITGVPTSMAAGTSLTLSGTVTPSNATNKTVAWNIKNAGTTGATINGNTLMAKTSGTVTISATVKNGASKNRDYTQDFSIMVKSSSLKVDTGFKLSVGKGKTYQFKITSDTKPTFVCGTSSTFTVRFNGSKGHDYFYVVTAVGQAGQSAGFYVNGSRCTVGTVTAPSAKVDTGSKLSVKRAKSYQFKVTYSCKPTFVCGTPSTFTVRFNGSKGSDYFYVVTAVGKVGQAAGFYLDGIRCTIGTIK